MKHFQFYNPVRILFGAGQIVNITTHIPQGSKVMMIYGGGSIKKNGIYEQVTKALAPFEMLEFSGVEPNPKYETLMKAVEIIKREKVDFLLAVGGGSVIDGTKFIAAATYYEGTDPYEICTKSVKITKALPFGAVLTIPATGSEMNCGGVISRISTQEKFAFKSSLLYPKFSVLDPVVCCTLPKHQRANGVVDAFIHTTEQYLTYAVNAAVQDRFSEAILKVLIDEGKRYVEDENDIDAASNIMWAASMALNGLIAVGVPEDWSTHMIGHEITALAGVDHGKTLAIVWPGVQRVMKEDKRSKLLQFAERVWDIPACFGNEDQRIEEAIVRTENFFHSLGVKTRLSDYPEIPEGMIDEIVRRFNEREFRLGERSNMTGDVVKTILESRK